MKIKSILGTIGKDVFPFIATAASGNIPGLVAMAAQKVASVIGVDKIEPTADAIDAAIVQAQTTNPDILLKLKEADHEFEIKMAELGFDSVEKMAEIDAGDRANARAREVAVKDVTPKFLAFAVTFGFFGLLWLLAFRAVPESSKSILDVMVGSLGTAWIGIINYYFGSSSGSAAKTEILATQAAATATEKVLEFKKAA